MDFKTAAELGRYISKEYAEDFFTLLVNYKDISASEAASRLNLHINTAQEFLEAMAALDVVTKTEVYEKKRPYYRYSLKASRIVMDIDLSGIRKPHSQEKLAVQIRERKNAGARFAPARSGESISTVAIWSGHGRDRKEARINLTAAQGRFLYHLPFPDADFLAVSEIMSKAGVDESLSAEILDAVELLRRSGVIEVR
jgi:predicted transcriptional regulator